MDLLPPTLGAPAPRDDLAARADAYATAPLLNCLLREVARPVGEDGPSEGAEAAAGGLDPRPLGEITGVTEQSGLRGAVHPTGDCVHPSGDCVHPNGDCVHPSGDCVHPNGDFAHPAGESAHPAGDCAPPAGDCVPPVGDSARLVGDSAHPAGESARRAGDSARPVGGSTHPTGDFIHPVGGSTQPTGDSIHPAGGSTQPPGEFAPCPAAHPPWEPGDRRVYRLVASGRLLRVSGARRPVRPEVRDGGGWRALGHRELVALVADELLRHTGRANPGLVAEMAGSRDVVAALLAARARATPPGDPYLRSEQSLITGHPHHPAPKARGGGPPAGWLPYAPEAHARFPLELLGVHADTVVEEGDTAALDTLGEAPPGYRLLPAHPWQLRLAAPALADAFADGRLIRLGTTAFETWPTAAIRTVYAPGDDLFLKFSLDVRITNDIRRLWEHDLRRLRRTDKAVTHAFAALGGPAAWLSDRGYRTASFAFEELAVVVRDGLRGAVLPGATPLLAAGLVEGFAGSPPEPVADPAAWWTAYLRAVVPPALAAYADHGVVLEAHLQNTLVAVDADGMPVQALFRDAEGVKLLPDVTPEAGWERLVYCLVVNHLTEVAAALAERHPGLDPWPAARRELARHDLPEAAALLAAPTLPGKTNLLLRWTGADGAAARYRPLPNPLAG